jgi:hypothetical protein
MKQFTAWPPPDWTECVVTWDWIMSDYGCHPDEFYKWCNDYNSVGRYHVHGWQGTEGFAFRFERREDATWFKLKWNVK